MRTNGQDKTRSSRSICDVLVLLINKYNDFHAFYVLLGNVHFHEDDEIKKCRNIFGNLSNNNHLILEYKQLYLIAANT